MRVFYQRDWQGDQFGDVLGGLNHFCGVYIITFARDDRFVRSARCYVFCYAGVEF